MNIEFSEEDIQLIKLYQEAVQAVSIKAAILNAISLGLDNEDLKL